MPDVNDCDEVDKESDEELEGEGASCFFAEAGRGLGRDCDLNSLLNVLPEVSEDEAVDNAAVDDSDDGQEAADRLMDDVKCS